MAQNSKTNCFRGNNDSNLSHLRIDHVLIIRNAPLFNVQNIWNTPFSWQNHFSYAFRGFSYYLPYHWSSPKYRGSGLELNTCTPINAFESVQRQLFWLKSKILIIIIRFSRTIELKTTKQFPHRPLSPIMAGHNKSKKEVKKQDRKSGQIFIFIFAKHSIQIQKNIQRK